MRDLYARAPRGMRLGLEPMRAACTVFGSPERSFPVVHVAGTNGKGSVSAMVEAIARASGKKTGLYTSPHLCRFAERIRVGGESIGDLALTRVLALVLAKAPDLSFFETATLAAFVAFREAEVDLAVVEVGIGGRLDATNVVPPPLAAAITRIAVDHTDKLGGTIAEIAREKAGIAKPGVPVVTGPLEPSARDAIALVAQAAGAKVVAAAHDPAAAAFAASAKIGLTGRHQLDNAKVAFVLGKLIGAGDDAIATGIADARWPGRLETVASENGPTLLDAAHNPDGAAALAAHLRELARPFTLVFGTLADKDWHTMIDTLAPLTPDRVYVAPAGRAATSPAAIAARHAGLAADSVPAALAAARAHAGRGGLVVVSGSIYLVGEARAFLLGLPRDPPVAL